MVWRLLWLSTVLVETALATAAHAGETRATPPVNVVAPTPALGALEPDDLPPPQPEVAQRATEVELPVVPEFPPRRDARGAEILAASPTSPTLPGEAALPNGNAASPTSPALPGEAALPNGSAVRSPDDAATSGSAAGPVLRKRVDETVLDISVRHLNACNHALAARRFEPALAACQAALTAWDGNHLAWYAKASAHMARGAWREALPAIARAVTLRPDLAMYQLYHGTALYEVSHLQAREGATTASAASQLQVARDALLRAGRLAPALWRAHYYLGRIYRELDAPRLAAEQLTQAIQNNPAHRPSYVALSALYRQAGHVDHALAVATLGTVQLAAADTGDLWLEVGLAQIARSADEPAIEALGKAIAARPTDPDRKLLRGWLYARKRDLVSARRDLHDVISSPEPSAVAARSIAQQMLAELAGRKSLGGKTACTAADRCDAIAPPFAGWSGWSGTDPITRL